MAALFHQDKVPYQSVRRKLTLCDETQHWALRSSRASLGHGATWPCTTAIARRSITSRSRTSSSAAR